MTYVSETSLTIVEEENKRYLSSNPRIEEITKEDIKDLLRDVMRNKPQQFSLGEFQIRHCDSCHHEFVLHKRQTFCPICYEICELIEEDANFDYDELFQKWQGDKNFLENILYSNKDAVLYLAEDATPDMEENSGNIELDLLVQEKLKNDEPIIEEL